MSAFLDEAGVQHLWEKIKSLVSDGVAADLEQVAKAIIELRADNLEQDTKLNTLTTTLNGIVENPDEAINSFNEIVKFLEGVEDAETLEGILAQIGTNIQKVADDASKEIAAGDDEVKALVVKLHAAITYSASKTAIEKGVNTTVSINHSAKFDGANLTYALEVNGEPVQTSYTVNDTTVFNGVFKINNADPKLITDIAKSVTVNAYYPKYYGGSTKTTLASADITALTKQNISSGASGTYNITSADDEYIWFCVPSTMTINKVTLGGFGVPLEAAVTVTVTGKTSYKCYRTTNPLSAGTRSFSIS